MTMIVLAIAILGVVPTSAYTSMRINMLLLFTFKDYHQMPINSLPILQTL